MNDGKGQTEYILGDSDDELVRLERQSLFFAEPTGDLLERAGLKPGMHVLDVGCGVGDVALQAARMVGPEGTVTGVDKSEQALASAKRRAAAGGLANAAFQAADLNGFAPGRKFDAIVGRFILLHMPNPAAAVSNLLPHLNSGGVIGFVEMDISAAMAVPPMALFDQCLSYISGVYKRVGLEPDMGSKLFATFRAAGLKPQMVGSVRIEDPWGTAVYEYFVESLRILAPVIEKTGIIKASEIGLDTLGDRLRTAAIAGEHCFYFPRVIGAWATT
jgi:ubiquinone/menaquinone biosynthesis C-methylase UbiE